MGYIRGYMRSLGFEKRVLYSPSTHRVIAPVDSSMVGTIQLNETFRVDRVIYAAPVDIQDMVDSWSNQDIDDWEERKIIAWTDLEANH